MKTLKNYFFFDLLKPALGTLVTLLAIIWLIQSLRFLDFMVNKGLDFTTFFKLTGFLVPSLLIVITPLSLFAGVCMCFKRLQDDYELPILFSAGISRHKMAKFTVFATFLAVCFGYFLTFWAFPAGMTAFKQLQHELRSEHGTLFLEESTFNQFGDNIMVYIKERTGETGLKQLMVHDTRFPERPVTWFAKEGRLIVQKTGHPRLQLTQGLRQETTPNGFNMLEFEHHTLDISKKISATPDRWRDAEERFVFELLKPEPQMIASQIRVWQAEFHKRLLWPLTPIPLMLIAALFLTKSTKNRQGTFSLMTKAVLFGFLYQGVVMILHSQAKGSDIFLYGQWLWPIFVSLTCLTMMRETSNG